MLIEIYSDVVCPWCAIGKARFEKALDQIDPAERAQIEVVWRPYQLDPTAPKTPSPVSIGYAKKFGGPERAAQIIDHVTKTAADDGITFRMDIAQRANTFDAHRLIGRALAVGGTPMQHAMKQRLLDAYFTQGVDVADHTALAGMAVEAGVFDSAEHAVAYLESNADVAATREEIALGVERGVSAVPTFVFENKWSVPGAQDPEVFVRVLDRLFAVQRAEEAAGLGEQAAAAEATRTDADTDAAEQCAVDGSNC